MDGKYEKPKRTPAINKSIGGFRNMNPKTMPHRDDHYISYRDSWTPRSLNEQISSYLSAPGKELLSAEIVDVSVKYPDIFLDDDDQALVGNLIADWRNSAACKEYEQETEIYDSTMQLLLNDLLRASAQKITIRFQEGSKRLPPQYCLLAKVLCGRTVSLKQLSYTPTMFDGAGVKPKLPTNKIAVYSYLQPSPAIPMRPRFICRGPVMTVAHTAKGAVMLVAKTTRNNDGLEITTKAVGHNLRRLKQNLTNDRLQALLLGKERASENMEMA